MARPGVIVQVTDSSQVAQARRMATQLAHSLRFGETAAGKAALVATELATNLIKHGGGGSIVFAADGALTLAAIDKGRGIANVDAALRDGFSTAGSPGTGLGAVSRASDSFDVYSLPGQGTAVLCKVVDKPVDDTAMRIGGVGIPKPGEEVSGDAWTAAPSNEWVTVAVADGLGHGPIASTASATAARVIADRGEATLESILADAHEALRPTRGAAVGIARIHPSSRRIDFVGVGNIAGGIVDEDVTRRVVSLPGIVGHEMRKVQTFSYPWTDSSVLILHSDGVSASWNARNYPGLMQHDPALIAAVIYRDFGRTTDDATVVVAKGT